MEEESSDEQSLSSEGSEEERAYHRKMAELMDEFRKETSTGLQAWAKGFFRKYEEVADESDNEWDLKTQKIVKRKRTKRPCVSRGAKSSGSYVPYSTSARGRELQDAMAALVAKRRASGKGSRRVPEVAEGMDVDEVESIFIRDIDAPSTSGTRARRAPKSAAPARSVAALGRKRSRRGDPPSSDDSSSSSEDEINPRKRRCIPRLPSSSSSSSDEDYSQPIQAVPPQPAFQAAPVQAAAVPPAGFPHTCQQCGKSFPTKRGLGVHKAKKPNCRPGVPPVSGPTAGYLTRQQKRKEMEEKYSFLCVPCTRAFRTPRGLATHRNQHCRFERGNQVRVEVPNHPCDCGRDFKSRHAVVCHQNFGCQIR